MNKKYTYLIIAFLIVTSFIAFGRIIGNDFINFDDNVYMTNNNYIKSGINLESIKWAFTSSYASNWHPLTWLSHILDWQLFGANASGHHLVSLLLHIGGAILLFLFLNKSTGSLWPSAFVAAFFALHPLRVESVAWAAERKDVLSMFLGLASIYAYAYYVESSKLSRYFIALILFSLSLMAKPMLVTLPFLLLLLDYWPLGRWHFANSFKKIQSLLWEKVPFILLSIASSILTIWAQNSGGAVASLGNLPLLDRILNAIVSYIQYLMKIFWPVDLAVFYTYRQILPTWQIFDAAAIILGISIIAIYAIKKAPFLFVGWFWYLGTLVPVIGLMQVGNQSIADRYTYFPSIGIAIILACGIYYLLPKEKLHRIILIPATAIILVASTFLTWQQCGYWKNSISLFTHVVQVTNDNYLAHNSLGSALAAEGKNQEAIAHFREAFEINPTSALALTNLCMFLVAEGKNQEAIAYYFAAIQVNPDHFEANYNLAELFVKQNKLDQAILHFREAVRITPSSFAALNNLGVNLEGQLKHDEAIFYYRRALLIEPQNPGIYFNLGVALGNKGELKEAIEHFRQAINLKPDYEEARRALKLAQELEKRR